MTFEVLSEHACFGGVQGYYKHSSTVIGLPMRFGVYRPPQACGPAAKPVPVLVYLAGLTCNEETFADQGRRAARGGRTGPDAGDARHQPARHRHRRGRRGLGFRHRRRLLP